MTEEHDETNADQPPPLLEYRSPADERRQWPKAVQALIGFVLCGGTSAAFNFGSGFAAASFTRQEMLGAILVTLMIVLVPLFLFGMLGWNLRRRGVWPAFLPGALAGWAVAFLVEGFCFVSLMGL